MDSIETNKDAIDQELKCITATPVVVPKDHKDDVSYFLKMLKQGVPVYDDSSGCWLFDNPRANLL